MRVSGETARQPSAKGSVARRTRRRCPYDSRAPAVDALGGTARLKRRERSRGATRAAAARSSSHRVRSRPRAPAAGTWVGPAPLNARSTASALAGPAAISHTCSARRIECSDSEIRTGGGFGAPRTAHTVRVSYTEGCSGKRSEEHTSELQSRENLVCRLLLEKKNKN